MVVHRFEITICYVLSICFGSDEADRNSECKKKKKKKERERERENENENEMENE